MYISTKKISIFMSVGVIGILTMLVAGMVIILNIDLNSIPESYVINISLDIFGIVIALILFHSGICEAERVDKALFLFLMLVFCNAIQLFADIIAWTVQGVPELVWLNMFDNFIFYSFGIIIDWIVWNYIRVIIKSSSKFDIILNKIINIVTICTLIPIFLNCFFGFYFTVDEMGVYRRTKETFMYSNIGPSILVAFQVYFIIKGKASINKKLSLFIYIILPYVFVLIQDFTFGLSLLYISTLCSVLIIYSNVQVARGRELIEQKAMIADQEKKIAQGEAKLTEQRMKILLSQMKPHFIYNGMAAIRRLIKKRPDDAVVAMDHFIGYLRGSIDMLDKDGLIPIEQELKFAKDYLELERVRFGEELEYEIHMNNKNFLVPPISIQTLVENSVRHGIRKKLDGVGKVIIETGKTDSEYFIEIKDNGVGFDTSKTLSNDRSHIGVKNAKERYERLLKGTMNIESEIGVGTTITIYIPLRGEE